MRLGCAALLVLILPVIQSLADSEWDAGGAGNRDWSTAANWTANTEPTSVDAAYVNGGYTGVVSQAGERALNVFIGSTNQPSNGANSTGRVEQSGGDLVIGSNLFLGKYAGGDGRYVMTGGTLFLTNHLFVGDQGRGVMIITNSASVTISGETIVGNSGTGAEVPGSRLTMGGGTLVMNNPLRIGGDNTTSSAADGLLEQFGGSITVSEIIKLGDNNDSTGRVMIAGGTFTAAMDLVLGENVGAIGTMNVSGDSFVQVGGTTYVSRFSGSVGTLSVSGGLFAANGSVEIGNANGGAGTFSVTGGRLTSTDIVLGRQGVGVANISGGSVTAQTLAISYAPNGIGTLNVSGGRLALTGTGENFSMRRRGGLVNISGGTVEANGIAVGSVVNHNTSVLPATVNLSGGTLSGGFANDSSYTHDFYIGATGGGTGVVNITGGLLDLNRSNNDLVIGRGTNSVGIFTMGGGTALVAGVVRVGVTPGGSDPEATGNGELFITNGLLRVGGNVSLPVTAGSTATVAHIGGTVDAGGNVTVGNEGSGGAGRYVISGGTFTNGGSLLIGHASSGSGYFEVAGSTPVIRVGNLTMTSRGELRSRFSGSSIAPILVAGTITANGTLSVTNVGSISDGTYLIATSLNGTAVSGRFSATNWLGGITGTVSYANNRITLSFTVPPASISGQVRYDSDGDGDVNDADAGIERVTVRLFTDPNADGDPADGVALSTNLTSSTGAFSFAGLTAGNYVVVETDRAGYRSTFDTGGANDNMISVILSGVSTTNNIFLDTYEYVNKRVDKTAANVNETLSYTLTPFYAGNGSTINMQISDAIPTGTTYVVGSANGPGIFTNGVITWSLGSAGSGVSGTLSTNFAGNLSPSADTYIDDGSANSNYGSNNRLNVNPGSGKGNSVMNSLITFDLSSIPSGATINSAWLRMEVESTGPNVNIYRGTTAWTGGGATWNKRDGSANWAGGGAFSASDYNATLLGTFNTGSTGVKSNNVLTTVQSWVQGTTTNRGFTLVSAGGANGTAAFYSNEEGTASRRPSLFINWSLAGTANSIDISPNMVGGTSEVKVVMSLTSPSQLTNVTPSTWLATNVTGGVTATLISGPDPSSATVHTNPVTFTYYYQVASGTSTGTLSFTGGATAPGGSFSNATSDRILVTAPLTFRVTVTNPPGVTFVTNQARFTNSGGLPTSYSQPVTTYLFSVVSGQVRNDADGDGDIADADAGISNVTVVLNTDPNGDGNPADGSPVATNITDASGNFTFSMLATGNYVLVESDPPEFSSSGDSQGANDNRIAVNLPYVLLSTNHVFLDVKPSSISGQVREDTDGDGDLGDPDSGIAGVTVVLYTDPNGDGNPADGAAVATNVTDGSGNYLFVSNAPGTYVVQQSNLSGYLNSADSQGANDNRIAISLVSGTDSTGNIFLDMRVASVSGFVRNDTDGLGNLGGAYSGITNVIIVLYTDPNGDGNPADGLAVDTNLTDHTGAFVFPSNSPGYYVVTEIDPTNFVSSADSQGANDNRIAILLASGSVSNGLIFLDTQRASISGRVRHDIDGDGDLGDADSGITNVTIVLFTDPDGNGDPVDGLAVATNVTDASGNYLFGFYVTGSYVVVETDPAGYVSTADSDPPNNNQIRVTLPGGQHSVSNNFLDTRLVVISGQVRHDIDGDGNVSDPDSGLASITVTLWTDPNADGNPADGSAISNKVTDAGGNFAFTNLFPGSYVLVETDLAGYVSTADSQGTNDNRIAVTLSSGNNSTNHVFLDSQLVSISGQVRHDTDADGSFADADAGISNVTIVLWTDPNGDGNPADGSAIRTNVTDSSGNYLFSGVQAGNYVIVETDPSGYQSTADTQGANDNRIAIALSAVVNSTGNNFLDSLRVTVGGQVRLDADYDGDLNDADSGLAGAIVRLFTDPNRDGNPADGAAIATNITTSTGYFSFTNLLAGGYVLIETDPSGYVSTADSVGANNNQIALILASGAISTNNIFLDSSAEDPDLPGVTTNLETIVAGSWIVPMDNSKQNIGSAFNLKAYGLLSKLLHASIPVKWAIRTGKSKDQTDFTAYSRRIYPSSTTASNTDYLAGPFIIPKIFTNQAAAIIASYGNNVAVYEVLSNFTADIRYTINTRPVVAALNDGGTIAIHVNALLAAGFVENESYYQRYAYNTNPISTNACYSFASEPHFHSTDPSLQAQAIRAFVYGQGNFLAQCAGVETYENQISHGRFHTSLGIVERDDVSTYTYPNADMPFVQFEGDISDEGGSLHEWGLSNSSTWVNNTFIQVQGVQNTNTYRATHGKVVRGISGGNVFYLGGHDYNGTTIGDINGRRMYMNAVFVPSLRPEDCQLTFGADLAITKTDGSQFAPAGSTNVYTIVVTNNGPDSVLNATVTDVFPANFTNARWSAVGFGGAVVPNGNGTGDISELIDLPKGGSVWFSVTGLVLSSSSCLISNVAMVSVPANVVELTLTNNRADDVSITHAISIGGQVRNDQDGDGDILDADPGITNVTVVLYTDPNADGDPADGAIISTQLTDASGRFLFLNVTTGRYVVEETDLTGYLSTGDSDGTNDNRISFYVECGITGNSTNNVFLDSLLGSISGFVREDADGDGDIFDPDAGISNVVVRLFTDPNGDGNPVDGVAISTNITSGTGAFTFVGVTTGSFVLVATDASGFSSTGDSQGANDNQIAVLMPGGQNSSGHIFLDTRPVNVGGQVREDVDGDGDLSDPDSGIPAVTVVLWTDPNGDGNPADGIAINTNVTDGTGTYLFTNINAGRYVLVETDLSGYVSTGDRQGANDNRIALTLVSSGNTYSNDFLDTRPANIFGQVRDDVDGDGDLTDPDAGITNVTIRLFTDPNRDGNPGDGVAIRTNVTDVSGNYSFTNITPGYYVIVETDPPVYQSTADRDGGNLNWITLAHLSGIVSYSNDFLDTRSALISGYVREDQYGDANVNAANPGILNVPVVLFSDPNGDGNPADGIALSTNLTDSSGYFVFPFLSPANYVVVETDLAGYISSTDSDGTNDNRVAAYLPGGVNSTNHIFLDLRRANVSGQVRDDVDGDGDLTDPDAGISGVTIRLFTDPNRDGDPSDGVAALTNVTDVSGNYSFTNLYPGYYVIVETDPSGYLSTADRDGGNFNWIALPHRSGVNTNGNDFLDSVRAAIRGQVRNDIDGDGDFNDPDVGIDRVTMTLFTDPNGDGDPADGVAVATNLTDSSGNYVFNAQPTGRYVVVETDRDGYVSTADSDPPNNNRVRVTLPGGVDSNGNNFLDNPNRVFKTVDATTAFAGDTLTYSIYTFYAGNQALTNVVLTDPVPSGTTYSAGSANAGGTFTNGVVSWRLGSTAPGVPGVIFTNFSGNISPSGDTYIDDGSSSSNYGSNNRLNVNPGSGKGNSVMNSLITFDLSSIPSGATISEAWLRLEVQSTGPDVNVYRATTLWTSGGATWNKRDGSANWAGGGSFSASDYNASLLGTLSTGSSGVKSNNVLSTVQSWVLNTTTNRGFALVSAGGANGTTAFYSNEEGTSSRRPSLFVSWSLPGTSNSIDVIPSLISGTSAVQVVMTLSSPTLLTNVTPQSWLSTNVTGGVTATLISGPSPASATVHTNPVSFSYVYRVTSGSTTGSLSFTGGATAPGGTFMDATSDRIIVAPLIRYSAQIAATPSVSSVTNIATLFETNFIPATNSNPVITLLRSAISGQVRHDLNANGSLADPDPGLTNVTITLFTDPNGDGDPSDGTAVDTNVTDSLGNYRFQSVFTGRFVIVETDPAGAISTADSQGANDNRIAVHLPVLSLSFSNIFLDTFPVTVSGQVRNDTDADADPGDPDFGLSNVTIRLFSDPNADGDPADGVAVATNLTSSTGDYSFGNVLPGRYVIVETVPATFQATGDRDGGVLYQIVLSLTSRVNSVTNYFLVSQRAAIYGSVLEDLDGDGDLAEADPALTNVTVVLYTDPNGDGNPADGVAIETNLTSATGSFFFGGLDTGTYVLVQTDLPGFISITDRDPPNDNRIRVNMPGALNSVSNIFLDAVLTVISGQVRHDGDGDGDFTDADSGLPGATIQLFTDPNGDGNPVDGALVSNLVTPASGLFQFTNLLPGVYVLVETDPSGYASTADTVGANDNRIPRVMLSRAISTNNIFLDAIYAGISITKESSIEGDVSPGEVITYTIRVSNNSVVAHSGTTIIDNLPVEMTYVADSTHYINGSVKARDTFDSASYTNQNGALPWSSNWQEEGEGDGASAGGVQATGGRLMLNSANRGISRRANLSGFSRATLNFNYRIESFDNGGDVLKVYASSNGVDSWVELHQWVGPIALSTGAASYDISSYISTNTAIRFLAAGGIGNDDFGYFDNVEIEAMHVLTGNNPPALLQNAVIGAGQTITITFDAIAEASVVLVNEACVTTAYEVSPFCAYASNQVVQLLLTQGVVTVLGDTNEAWHLSWNAISDPVTRDYDIIYVDTVTPGFNMTLTNQWDLAARIRDRYFEDLGSSNHPPAWGMGEAIRFYRAAHKDRWLTNQPVRNASRQVYVAKAIQLSEGENWVSLFMQPDRCCVAGVFGTNVLPSGPSMYESTMIEWYGATATGAATNTIWLDSISKSWRFSGGGNADNMPLPLNEGFNVVLPPGSGPFPLPVIGLLPTNISQSLGTIQSLRGSKHYNVVSYNLPYRVMIGQSGLREAGFKGLSAGQPLNPNNSDEIRILQKGGGSMASPVIRILMNASSNFVYWTGGSGSAESHRLNVDDAIIIYTRKSTNNLQWNIPLPYAPPTPEMTP